MKKFKYTAIDINKKKYSGVFLSKSEEDLRQELAEQGYYIVKCKEVSKKPANSFFTLSGSVKRSELTAFARQLAILINSNISIIKSFDVLMEQEYSTYLKNIIGKLKEDVKSGLLLSQALNKYKSIFPDFFRSMVHIGEISSNLPKVLVNIADYYEADLRTRKKVKAALTYPILIIALLVLVMAAILLFVIPTFTAQFATLDIDMPEITLAVMNMSDFFVANWYFIFGGIILIIAIMYGLKYTAGGRMFYARIAFKLPIAGKINMALYTSRFAKSFSLLIDSGMDIMQALTNTQIILTNIHLKKEFTNVIEAVKKGNSLSSSISRYMPFSNILNQMLTVGEETGDISSILLSTCPYFDDQVEKTLGSITSVIQPAILLITGVVVAVLFIAVYAPILQLVTDL